MISLGSRWIDISWWDGWVDISWSHESSDSFWSVAPPPIAANWVVFPFRLSLFFIICENITPNRKLLTMQPMINPAIAPRPRWERDRWEASVEVSVALGMIWKVLFSKIALIFGDVHDDGYLLLLEVYQHSFKVNFKNLRQLSYAHLLL